MFPQHILAGLGLAVVSVTAIDLRLFSNNNCGNKPWLTCNDANPKVCCGTTNEAYTLSAGVFAIPTNWNIVAEFWQKDQCGANGPLVNIGLSNGHDTVCDGGRIGGQRNYVRGVSYYFNGKKREVAAIEGSGCQRANILSLEDGSEYDLSSLDDSTYNNVLDLSLDKTRYSEIANFNGTRLIT